MRGNTYLYTTSTSQALRANTTSISSHRQSRRGSTMQSMRAEVHANSMVLTPVGSVAEVGVVAMLKHAEEAS